MSTDSTRHKSKNGETHSEAKADFSDYIEHIKAEEKKQLEEINRMVADSLKKKLDKLYNNLEEKPVIADMMGIEEMGNKSLTFDSLSQAKRFFQNSTFHAAVYYDYKTKEKLLEEFKLNHIQPIGWQMKKGETVEYKKPDSEVGGIKETDGKLDYSEINFKLLDLMAKRFMDNKVKYPKGNTKKDLDKNEILLAAFRHIRKMIQPIENDPETFEDHLAAVATNMSIVLDQLEK